MIKDEFSSPKFPWHGINFLSSSPSKHQNLESYLVNVNIYNVWEHNVNLSSLQAAIVSNTIFPYTKNVKIARSLKAVVIHDRHIDKQEVILNGINIEDCPIGIHVINSTTNSSSIIQGNFSTPFIHLEKIKIKRCIKALSIENHLTKNISLNDITITSCVNGIDAKFIETLGQASEMTSMNHATSYAHYMNKIKITECYNAIHIYNPSTKDIHLSKITVVNCSFGIDVENSLFSRFTVQTTQIRTGQSGIGFRSLPASMLLARSTSLCDSVDYNVTYPLEVRLLSYKHSRPCKKVSEAC